MAYSSGHQIVSQLRRRRLGVIHLVFFTVAASAPLTVLGGGVTTAFAVTGVPGVPLAFLILALSLAIFAAGYAAMSRFVANAGAFYSYLAQGLGRVAGVAGAFVALVAYNAIQIGLYGLFGATMADFASTTFGLNLEWWLWALVALALVGALGVLRVDLNATILAVLLVLECVAVVLYDLGALGDPADGTVSFAGFQPDQLFIPGVGAVFAFGVACFIGFESSAIYSEECKDPQRTVGRATFVAVIFTGLFYAFSAWAMTVNVGPANLQAAAAENGPGLVFGALGTHYAPIMSDVAGVLFLTSVFAALLSFHNGVARYFFALGRERVLPDVLDTVGTRSGGPVAGSLLQTAIAVVVLAIFVVSGTDPVLELFTWFSGVAALGVVLLMAGTSAAVVGFFRRHPNAPASVWQRLIAPVVACVLLSAIVIILVANFDALLGTDPTSPLRWILPALVLVAAAGGAVWALVLRSSRPAVYAGIGHVALAPVEEEPRLDLPTVSRRR
ncbi:APC family permease [Pseudonocardia sp. S2-4]|uniref:APC family permease n=1 Tax=Pseudonocardia humida TaxID=2800819 RepID=A0ABT1A6S4_9PSEU|nr:APC family permease [Pseudonocardia humida]